MSLQSPAGRVDGPDRVIRDDLDLVVRACNSELSKLSGSTLLLTGATGFVGRYLVESVIRFNRVSAAAPCVLTLPTRHPELLMLRYRSEVEANEVVVVEWGNGYGIDLPGRRWDYVVHGAAVTDPIRFMEDPDRNLRDTISMAASVAGVAKASGAKRLVLIGSGAVYGDQPADLPEIPETFLGGPDISLPTASYAEAKRVSELLFRLSGLDQRVARVFSLLGPYQDLASSFAVPDLIRQAAEHGVLRLTTDGSARRSYCYATDLTVFLVKLLLGDVRHEIYNVGSRRGTATIAEVSQVVADIFGGLEVHRASAAPSQRNYVPQLDRLYETCAPQVGLREGLLRTCHSLYARGLIDKKPVADLESPASRS
jgi:dTDP-glucose 4,6-dehydratase